uniref:Secreted protein n=1 Tax=Panagrellus redivivus TaxID=6233 RepID=A0A7E4VL45_PANRE
MLPFSVLVALLFSFSPLCQEASYRSYEMMQSGQQRNVAPSPLPHLKIANRRMCVPWAVKYEAKRPFATFHRLPGLSPTAVDGLCRFCGPKKTLPVLQLLRHSTLAAITPRTIRRSTSLAAKLTEDVLFVTPACILAIIEPILGRTTVYNRHPRFGAC